MGYFDEWTTPVDEIPTETFDEIKPGSYELLITEVGDVSGSNDNGEWVAVNVKLQIVGGDDETQIGKIFSWLGFPPRSSSEEWSVSLFKKNLLWFGVPEKALKTFNADLHGDRLVGNAGVGTFKIAKKSGRVFLANFELTGEDASVTNVPASVPVETTPEPVAAPAEKPTVSVGGDLETPW